MFYNKEQKIKYLGFNDRWFIAGGTVIIALMITLLFNAQLIDEGVASINLIGLAFTFIISLIYSCIDWILMRYVLVKLRKVFPSIKDSLKRSLLFLVAIVVIIVVVDALGNQVLYAVIGDTYHPMQKSGILIITLISIMTMAIYEAIYYQIKLMESVVNEQETKQVIVKARLDALRNQARPHFLFNSFNTLRDIIDQDAKEDAKDFVDKLSDVYRFILDTGNSNMVPLQDELAFAKAYIHIQKERFGDNLQLEWDIPSSYLSHHIVPMSLQLLLENAIKHNVVSRLKPLSISINVKEDTVIVANKINLKTTQVTSTKLGLANIKDRYRLIGDKEPIVTTENGVFSVALPLYQSSHLHESTNH